MQMDKKRITALGVCLAAMGFLARKNRRDELRYWLEYQANRLGVIIKHTKGF
ncbi:MAG: hypothetical protein ACE5J5_03030 [Candidatus Hydrothermarchaeales archaeon]